MGKGDRKSKKGKIFMGSFGNSRKRKVKARKFVVQKKAPQPLAAAEVVTPQVAEQMENASAVAAKPKIKRATTAKKKETKAPKKVTKKGADEATPSNE